MKIIIITAMVICAAVLPVCGQPNGEMKMEQRLTIVTLGVSELEKSTEFYMGNFGWEKAESSNEDITFFQLNGMMLSLYERDELAKDAGVEAAGEEGFSGFTLSYNTRSEEEVNIIIEELRSSGVEIVKEPQKVFWGGYSSYIADPDEMIDTIWPEVGKSWAEDLQIFGEYPEYLVRYRVVGGDRPARHMSEYIRFEEDKIAEIEVFTGREKDVTN